MTGRKRSPAPPSVALTKAEEIYARETFGRPGSDVAIAEGRFSQPTTTSMVLKLNSDRS